MALEGGISPDIAIFKFAFDLGFNIVDSIFGDSTPGSGGVFRKAYKRDISDYTHAVTPTVANQGNAIYNETPPMGEQIVIWSEVLLDFLKEIDSGFDRFKGSNLLGQTMRSSRFNGFALAYAIIPMLRNIAINSDVRYKRLQSIVVQLSQQVRGLQQGQGAQNVVLSELQEKIADLEIIQQQTLQSALTQILDAIEHLTARYRLIADELAQEQREFQADTLRDIGELRGLQMQQSSTLQNTVKLIFSTSLVQGFTAFYPALEQVQSIDLQMWQALEQGNEQAFLFLHGQRQQLLSGLGSQLVNMQNRLQEIDKKYGNQIESLRQSLDIGITNLSAQQAQNTHALAVQSQLLQGLSDRLSAADQQSLERIEQAKQDATRTGCECAQATLLPVIQILTRPDFTTGKVLDTLCDSQEFKARLLQCLAKEALDNPQPVTDGELLLLRNKLEDFPAETVEY